MNGWKLDKHIPIALIGSLAVAVLCQSFYLGWYIKGVVKDVAKHEAELNIALPKIEDLRVNIAEMRQDTAYTKEATARIENRLDRIGRD